MKGLNSVFKKAPVATQPAIKDGETYQVLTGVGSLGAASVLSLGLGRAIRPHLPCYGNSLFHRNALTRGMVQCMDEADEAQVIGPIDQFISEGYDELEDEVPKKPHIEDDDYED